MAVISRRRPGDRICPLCELVAFIGCYNCWFFQKLARPGLFSKPFHISCVQTACVLRVRSKISPLLCVPSLTNIGKHCPSQTRYTQIINVANLSYLRDTNIHDCRSRWPRGLRRWSAATRLLGLRVAKPAWYMNIRLRWQMCVVR